MRDPYSYTFQSNLDYTDRSTGLCVCSEVSHTQMHPSAADGRTMQAGIAVSDLENRYQEYFLQLRAIQQFIEDYRDFDLTLRAVLANSAGTEAEDAVNVRLTCEQGTFWLTFASDAPVRVSISELPQAISFAWGAFFDLSRKLPVIGGAIPGAIPNSFETMSSFYTSSDGKAWYSQKTSQLQKEAE